MNKLTTLSRTVLNNYKEGEVVHIIGQDKISSMEYTPAGSSCRIMVAEMLHKGEKVRLTLLDPGLIDAYKHSKLPSVEGTVRKTIGHVDEVCDDILVSRIY